MFPKSVTADMLAELLQLVYDTEEAVFQVIKMSGAVPDGTRLALFETSDAFFNEYIGDLTLLQSLIAGSHQHSLGAWNASISAVYQLSRFDRLYRPGNLKPLTSPSSILVKLPALLVHTWINERDPGPVNALEKFEDDIQDALMGPRGRFDRLVGERAERPAVVFITALEHEFQSVVRRLDRIDEITSEAHYGFNLKLGSNEAGSVAKFSFYDASPAKERLRLSAGWAVGAMRGIDVAVICAGGYGHDRIKSSVDAFKKRNLTPFRSPECWCIVGVCAATSDREGRLGDVVVSSNSAFLLYREPSPRANRNAWSVLDLLPIEQRSGIVGSEAPDSFQFDESEPLYYRAPSAPSGTQGNVAKPPIMLYRRRFLVSPGVIRKSAERDSAVNAVRDWCQMRLADPKCMAANDTSQFQLDDDEWFGIEMECAGLEMRRSLIIKSIVDYADENKGGGWDDSVKLGIQLYAAEVAAETAYRFSHLLSPSSS